MPTLKSCSESNGAPSSALTAANSYPEKEKSHGAWGQTHALHSVWVWTSGLPHAGKAKSHHEVPKHP